MVMLVGSSGVKLDRIIQDSRVYGLMASLGKRRWTSRSSHVCCLWEVGQRDTTTLFGYGLITYSSSAR